MLLPKLAIVVSKNCSGTTREGTKTAHSKFDYLWLLNPTFALRYRCDHLYLPIRKSCGVCIDSLDNMIMPTCPSSAVERRPTVQYRS